MAACVPVSLATTTRVLTLQPWVYFGLPPPDFPSAKRKRAEREARENAAAASGHGGEPKKTVHHEPPSLEQAVALLKLEASAI